jgi:RNA polymerase sigma factor (sigma-70 family)
MEVLQHGPELEPPMIVPTPLDAEAEAGLFLEITSLARRCAATIIGAEAARDVAQDVVLACLIRFRSDGATIDLGKLGPIVRGMARRRAFDELRRADRRVRPDEDFMRELTDSTHTWMDPEAAVNEEELAAFHARTLASLPENVRRTYTMVREDGHSYREAAAQLGTSRATVNAHVVRAQRVFRKKLPSMGSPPRLE